MRVLGALEQMRRAVGLVAAGSTGGESPLRRLLQWPRGLGWAALEQKLTGRRGWECKAKEGYRIPGIQGVI